VGTAQFGHQIHRRTSLDLVHKGHQTKNLGALARAAGDVVRRVVGDETTPITGLSFDSRRVAPGQMFVCIPGRISDGHLFAGDAVAAGAAALCVERPIDAPVPQIVVADGRRAMARIAAAWFGYPADGVLLLGVTGTNGKTTTAFLLESILKAAGLKTGLIGTVETRWANERRPGVRTTPESLELQELLADMRAQDVDAVAMEVTSHGLSLRRVEGVRFDVAAFTNLSQDHLDFHSSMDEYFQAKRRLFTPEQAVRGVVNIDDEHGRSLAATAPIPVVGFGVSPTATVRAERVVLGPHGSEFVLVTPAAQIKIRTSLAGHFNISNCLAAAASALEAGIEPFAIEDGISSVAAVPGRFESIDAGQPFAVIVDYAHTPDSLDNVLRAARTLTRARAGRVLCAFGCGGDRDRGKRPLMGATAVRLADYVVVTSDNPRSEEPESIIGEILEGVVAAGEAGADAVLPDRRDAIKHVLTCARDGDVVVIAGKGHETGQQFADRTVPFDDRDVARAVLRELGYEAGH
jgi:UDP-N-acetylmuramoyl-L-alanyl-D-glutamate--2,6-diaminopimelate ligase